MLDLYYWPTPNGHKITLMLEELAEAGAAQAYRIVPVDIGKGAQFEPAFLAISPNNKMPALGLLRAQPRGRHAARPVPDRAAADVTRPTGRATTGPAYRRPCFFPARFFSAGRRGSSFRRRKAAGPRRG